MVCLFLLRLHLLFFAVYRLYITHSYLCPINPLFRDEAKKKRQDEDEEERRNVDKEETTIHRCVFHGLMMHGEAKQNRQQSVFCLTHYMLRGRGEDIEKRRRKNCGVLTCDKNSAGKKNYFVYFSTSFENYLFNLAREAVILTRTHQSVR